MEREADGLGLEYLYKVGYDPNSFVEFFEKIETLEKKKPGTVSKLFSTHPLTRSRINRAQHEIQYEMKPRAEYVVDTSEFQEIRQRVAVLDKRSTNERKNDLSPVLKRRSSDKIDQTDSSDSASDERPTLKRRR